MPSLPGMKENISFDQYSDVLIDPHSAAALLPGVSYQSILRWARYGKIPFVELPSGRKFFRRSDIEALLTPVGLVAPPVEPPDVGAVPPDAVG